MNEQDKTGLERRRLLKLLGGGAVLVPLATLTACGGDKAPPPAAEAPSEPAPEPAAPSEAEPAADAPAPDGTPELAMLSEDDPQAQSLGYVADASTVDGSRYPQFKAGQACSNCALFLAGDEASGPCSIFPGKAVMAAGWCSVYAPKA